MSKQQDFYNSVYSTAKSLGATDTQARLAASQASLETGYGKHVKGNNYFGIKAGGNYAGPSLDIATHEVVGGKSVGLTDKFRQYDGLAESVKGYMDFMPDAFPDAWNAGNLGEAAKNLAKGKNGRYATDPDYETKIGKIASNFGGSGTAPMQSNPTEANVPVPQPAPDRREMGLIPKMMQGFSGAVNPAIPDASQHIKDDQKEEKFGLLGKLLAGAASKASQQAMPVQKTSNGGSLQDMGDGRILYTSPQGVKTMMDKNAMR